MFEDTILFIKETQVVLDLMTVLRSSETVQLKKMLIHSPTASLAIDEDGVPNYDIFKKTSSKKEEELNENTLGYKTDEIRTE